VARLCIHPTRQAGHTSDGGRGREAVVVDSPAWFMALTGTAVGPRARRQSRSLTWRTPLANNRSAGSAGSRGAARGGESAGGIPPRRGASCAADSHAGNPSRGNDSDAGEGPYRDERDAIDASGWRRALSPARVPSSLALQPPPPDFLRFGGCHGQYSRHYGLS
jgi:hypothetical protein